ncbi:MAG: DoxX family protein [Candidatus Sulfotelmatobacter sp.]
MKIAWDRVFHLTLWILQIFLAILFLCVGARKLNPNAAYWIELFGKVGIGQWFRYFAGSLEVVCAILLLTPRTSAIAAAFLALIMAGAVATHLFILRDGYATFFPAFTLLLLAVVAWKRTLLRLGKD